ncbi:RNA polymerase sigma factor [bacterium]|nr:RNA polymerase sigma factor [bacterium]MCP5461633.1 RNA polymerase sigma factor [bacterium]
MHTNGSKYDIYTDEELVLKAKDTDLGAFDEFHARYLKKILNYVNRVVNDFQKAEEITQETFLQVYRHLDTYRPEGKVSSWIFKIATNLSKNELRNQRRRSIISLTLNKRIGKNQEETELIELIPDKADNPDTLAELNELSQAIDKAIDTLPLKYREVLLICEIYGYSYQEASEILNCSKANIGIRLCRARRKIKKLLNSMDASLPEYLPLSRKQ